MLIKEIELNNFRIYQGKNTINLLPEKDKNVIVVSGKNGYGKTTFLVSLVWCLYGKQMGKVDDLYQKEIKDKGTYAKYIAGCLNRKAKLDMENRFSVSVTFQGVKTSDTEVKEVKITRTHDIVKGEDEVDILIDNQKDEIITDWTNNNPTGSEDFIRELILPIDIAKFFLFDAEKIVNLAEVNSPQQRRDLSIAYSEVLGIKKYEDMRKELEIILDDTRKQSASPEEEKELVEVTAKIERCEIDDKNFTRKINKLKEEKDDAQKSSEEIQTQLVREGKLMTLEELDKFRETKKQLEEKTNNLKKELKELYEFIPFALAGETLIELQEQLTQEKEINSTNYKRSDIEEKTTKIINDIESTREKETELAFNKKYTDFYHREIKKQIRKYFFADIPEVPQSFKPLHDLPSSELNELNSLINQIKHSFKSKLEKINQDFYINDNELKSIDRKIKNAEKEEEDDYVRSLREQKIKLDKKIVEIEQEVEIATRQSEKIRLDKTTYEKKQSDLRVKIDDTIEFSEREQKVKEVLNLMKDNIAVHQKRKKESLEKSMLQGLNTLLHKQDFIQKVSVNINSSGEDVDIVLYNKREEKIDKVSLSMGERQMYASALLNALVDESDIEFPVFIDSPMQKFDEEHAENIIKHFYPNVSKQVVIFPLINKELTVKEYDILKEKVSKAYLIKNLNNDASQFIETEPQKLMEFYKEN